MTLDQARVIELAEAYRQQYVLNQGDCGQRAETERFWWAWEAVHEGIAAGTLPVEMLDALLHLGGGVSCASAATLSGKRLSGEALALWR